MPGGIQYAKENLERAAKMLQDAIDNGGAQPGDLTSILIHVEDAMGALK